MSDCVRTRVRGTIGAMLRTLVTSVVLACAFVVPAGALASEGDDVRVTGKCSGASTAALRLRADDGVIEVEARIDTRGRRKLWRVVLLHERRIAYRGALRTSASSGSLKLRRTVADWYGSDSIVVRATGPRGETCRASATI
jgi:hypothetical protein